MWFVFFLIGLSKLLKTCRKETFLLCGPPLADAGLSHYNESIDRHSVLPRAHKVKN